MILKNYLNSKKFKKRAGYPDPANQQHIFQFKNMSIIYNTVGIVIKKEKYRDYDRLLTLYTKDFGKIRALIKGVQKQAAKLVSLSELFVVSELRLFLPHGSAYGKILGGVILDSNALIRYNVSAFYEGSYIVELLDALTPDRQPNPEKFFLLQATLRLINKKILNQKEDFLKNLLHLTGFGIKPGVSLEEYLTEHLRFPLKSAMRGGIPRLD